ncbi:biotin-acetyl-carboxylase ligase [Tubulinosema ratisbonensis]|uniref:Biotin-acetyl-carboxylase ligase n=1 Tax=Tubulinosema ratisbonensis TaxID=291195 RepID=A0A437AKJ9_9MICR|nr:biotin-acetyl-carboxylase ligase [Tubulinosema ratisbonensis]
MKIINFYKLNSTQTKVKELLDTKAYKEKTFITTKRQTNGYGRSKSNWYTGKGTLCFSYAHKLNQSYLQILTNLKETFNFFKIDVQLKWPNDILLNGVKIAGVIVEKYLGYNIIGIGINLFIDSKINYKSVEELTGIKIDKFYFLFVYAKHFLEMKNELIMHKFVLFENKVHKICFLEDNLVLTDEGGKNVYISNEFYSYDCFYNEIIKKK